ncbi:glycoside hydrolase family 7 protein [Oidiodendron maius Zn]|uniref:cellulase n=1 Tax=Oidiodendron maius (strain Zn) TaxID=913774 RepID=A0A0C3GXW9_OIDMZ|nr:glycoside hydrolase family 7 protein [Oidiodendron maius Zn]
MFTLIVLATILPLSAAQHVCTETPEVHPQFPTWKCTTSGGCINSSISCTTSGGDVDPTLCPEEATCAQNCAIEGANYTSSGISTSGDSMTLHQYVTINGVTSNTSPRLRRRELQFDVNVSTPVCGENGALYLSEMDHTGSRTSTSLARPNLAPGIAMHSALACCNEMDIWETNTNASALTPHPCEGDTCDKSGCGFNPYAMVDHTYYGNGDTIDILQPFTVVTQFTLTEFRRIYIQKGQIIHNAVSSSGLDSRTADCGSSGPCDAQAGNLLTIEAQNLGSYTTFSNIRWETLVPHSPTTAPRL